jgi:hypothetical protein
VGNDKIIDKVNKDKNNEKKLEESNYSTLAFMIKVAEDKGYSELAKSMGSLLSELELSASMLRRFEKRGIGSELEELLDRRENISYLGPREWEEDTTYNTPLGTLVSDQRISKSKDDFYKLVSYAIDTLISEKGADSFKKAVVFEDMMKEASFSEDEALLNAMGSGMLDGIRYARKNPDKMSNTHYSQIKLLMQNLMLNEYTAPYIKEELYAAWASS